MTVGSTRAAVPQPRAEGAVAGPERAAGAPRTGWSGAVRWVGGGLLAGLVWGLVARLWMAYLTTTPQWTWEGTLFILGVTGLAGTALGALELLRRRGARVWRLVLVAPALVMCAGQGIFFLPAAVFGGLALSRRGPRWLRAVAGAGAAAPLLLFGLSGDDLPHSAPLSAAWFALLGAALAVGWTAVWRRRVRPV